nr:RteC domain-containing protein [uncultured Draconibacterium sp.]
MIGIFFDLIYSLLLRMEHYSNVILELEENLRQITIASGCMLSNSKLAIKRSRFALVELKSIVIRHGFPDQSSEIRFFKEIKPMAYSYLLFYQALFEMESFRSTRAEAMKQYLKNKLNEIQRYMEEHRETVQYYHCGYTFLDRFYFVRNTEEIPVELRGENYLMDEEFNTWQDYNFSVIRASEMLQEYFSQEILKLENPQESDELQQFRQLDWTANKIDLVELVYALYYSRAINNGKITIKELGKLIGQIFNVELNNDVYWYFIEIQQRKIDQTKFIGHLQSVLQQHIDQNILK